MPFFLLERMKKNDSLLTKNTCFIHTTDEDGDLRGRERTWRIQIFEKMFQLQKESGPGIVWIDRNIASPDCCKMLRKAFSTATNLDDVDIENLIRENSDVNDPAFLQVPFYFKLFSDTEPCRQFLIENAGKNESSSSHPVH